MLNPLKDIYLLPLETIETITEVQVEELWTKTVNKIPIISPTIGLASNGFPWNMEPVKMKACKKVCKMKVRIIAFNLQIMLLHFITYAKCTFAMTQLDEIISDGEDSYYYYLPRKNKVEEL